jgi:hypothetical protein
MSHSPPVGKQLHWNQSDSSSFPPRSLNPFLPGKQDKWRNADMFSSEIPTMHTGYTARTGTYSALEE